MTSYGDRLFGLFLFVIALAYGWGAQQWPEPFGSHEAVGPKTFPTILAIALLLGSIYLMVKPDQDGEWPARKTLYELGYAVVALFAYAITLETLGFIICTLIVVAFLSWRMGAKPKPALLIAGCAAVTVFVLFNYLLDLPLPLGILEVF